ncbi:type I restriction endonuclease [candidate division KSB1 bacterium]
MDLAPFIEKVSQSLKNGDYLTEAAVSMGIIVPMLQRLGWDTEDVNVVIPEYGLEGKRVDYALCCKPKHPIVFIEAKKPGQTEGADKQLFEYAFHKGIPLALLTDGREWHFYLPAGEGEYYERRVYKLDVIERDPVDSAERLNRYLEYGRMCSGRALEDARKDYADVSKKRHIEKTLPEAWRRILEEGDELLLELLAEKVEDLCGYRPELDACADFILNLLQPKAVDNKSKHVKLRDAALGSREVVSSGGKESPLKSYRLQQLVNKTSSFMKPTFVEIEGERISTRNWADLCVKFVIWLVDNKHITQNKLPIWNCAHRDKYFINNTREHADPLKNGYWKEAKGFYVDIKYPVKAHVKNIISTLEQLSLSSLDVTIGIH